MTLRVWVERLHPERDSDIPLPGRATEGSAGYDLRAALEETLVVEPGRRVLVPTGLRIALPPGHELQVRPRSGLAFKQGLTVLNAPGTIDSDYRGEVMVLLVNLGDVPVSIERGERVAQGVLAPVLSASWELTDSLEDTERGSGGFGSTGRGTPGE